MSWLDSCMWCGDLANDGRVTRVGYMCRFCFEEWKKGDMTSRPDPLPVSPEHLIERLPDHPVIASIGGGPSIAEEAAEVRGLIPGAALKAIQQLRNLVDDIEAEAKRCGCICTYGPDPKCAACSITSLIDAWRKS